MSFLAPVSTAIVPDLPDRQAVRARAVLATGELAMLGVAEDVLPVAARFQVWEGRAEVDTTLWTFDGDQLVRHLTIPLGQGYRLMDRFPDGRWLVASVWGESNARVLAPNGVVLDQFRLGNAIESLKIDASGRIWVGWFDEGITKNRDWKVPELSCSPSEGAMACFDDKGCLLWSPLVGSSRVPLDCEALNVAGDVAWLSSCGLLHRADGFSHTHWLLEHSYNRHAVVSDGRTALLVGEQALSERNFGAPGASAEATFLRLSDSGPAAVLKSWPVDLPLHDPHWWMDSRGDEVHVVGDGQWKRWSLATVLVS